MSCENEGFYSMMLLRLYVNCHTAILLYNPLIKCRTVGALIFLINYTVKLLCLLGCC